MGKHQSQSCALKGSGLVQEWVYLMTIQKVEYTETEPQLGSTIKCQ
jgi:hypothetical protein